MELTYLDNNATTRPAPQVVEAMTRVNTTAWGNPSSTHRFGQLARREIDDARSAVAKLVGCGDSELLFTAGGTEASNTGIRSLLASRSPRRKVVTSTVEHSATRQTLQALAHDGTAEVVEIPVDTLGRLDVQRAIDSIDDSVALVTLIWANNETGVVWDLGPIIEACKRHRVPIHVDATQAVGKIPVDPKSLGADCATIAGHKFHGPKGVGALFVRKGLRLRPLIIGGPQERERRGGTENVAGIAGMGVAATLALDALPQMSRVAMLRDRLEKSILSGISQTRVNGDVSSRLPNTTNIGFQRLEAEPILLLLSEKGVCASAGAACSSGSLEPSHVLRAMGIDETFAHGSIRFSLSRETTDAEVDRCLSVLPEVIERLRRVLPV
ncbi:MAG: aminotransferase class V-fold PLP-dependent enzyme [Tepidisphaeraceae bacterium]